MQWINRRGDEPRFVDRLAADAFVAQLHAEIGQEPACTLGAPMLSAWDDALFELHCDGVPTRSLALEIDEHFALRSAELRDADGRG